MDELLAILHEQARKLFDCRCVLCGRYSEIVHEILPRANGKRALVLENMVVLCAQDHDWAHLVGSKGSKQVLVEARKDYIDAHTSCTIGCESF